ncbi:MAG: hypothetical protein HQK55_14965, partial [Deltaproteobacteria bacterium]|nr:hypothetical protein [Deltaproteobacteria bacterium]
GLVHYLRGKSVISIRPRLLRPDKSIAVTIVTLGFAPFIMDLAAGVQNVILNAELMKHGGEYGIAALSIVFAINIVCMMISFGLGDGMQPVVSFNHGAQKHQRATQTVFYAILFGEGVSVLFLGVIELFPEQVSRLFVKDNPR